MCDYENTAEHFQSQSLNGKFKKKIDKNYIEKRKYLKKILS